MLDAAAPQPPQTIRAVVFDLDGVLLDSSHVWEDVVMEFVQRHGGVWRTLTPEETMAGGNSEEWSTWFKETCKLAMSAESIREGIISGIMTSYRRSLPLMPGAAETVEALAARYVIGLASASPRDIIDLVLELSGLAPFFSATVSADEVGKGKPNPKVYIECCRRLGVPPERCLAVEDAPDGLRAAKAAGLWTVAVPAAHPSAQEHNRLLADVVIDDLRQLTPELVLSVGTIRPRAGQSRFTCSGTPYGE